LHRFYYIVDSENDRVVRWTSNYAADGTCIVACTSSSGIQPNELNNPRDLKFDASGNLYVNDQGNNRIQKFMIQYPPNCTASKLNLLTSSYLITNLKKLKRF
jgi:hypothetical protein